jgi:putative CocE/NonD family hydrolase
VSANIVVQRNIPVTMRDGIVLYADLYVPDDYEHNRYPVLLDRIPYDKTIEKWPATQFRPSPPMLAAHGYAVVIQDVRGRFQSEGRV